MQKPLQIAFRGFESSAAVEERVREEVAKLEEFHTNIIGCRVVLETDHRRRRKGKLYNVRIDLTVPGAELIISRDPERDRGHEDIYVAIRDSFDALQRRLQDEVRRIRGAVKVHEEPPHGRIHRLFPGDGYGFIESSDGREIYFHRNSVLDDSYDKLEPGTEVWFAEEAGERGPQASTVRIVGKHRPTPV